MSDGWIRWFGHGTPPVTGGREVEIERRDGARSGDDVRKPLYWRWYHVGTGYDIVAYRVVDRRVGQVWGNEHHRRAGDNPPVQTKADGWIKWDGVGKPELNGRQLLKIKQRNGRENFAAAPASRFVWGHDGSPWDIVAYKLEERRSGNTPDVVRGDAPGVWLATPRRRKEDKKTFTRVSGREILAGINEPPAGVVLPTDAAARKALPAYSGFIAYFPDAIVAVAELSRKGNDQHNPGKPLHWDRSKSGDELDALSRHLLEAGTIDTDGVRHSTKLAWRAMANLQKEIERSRK